MHSTSESWQWGRASTSKIYCCLSLYHVLSINTFMGIKSRDLYVSFWCLSFFPSYFLFFKSLELYHICKAQSVSKAVCNFSPLNFHNTSGKKTVPQFPPRTAAGRKSELLSIAKEAGHGETEHVEIHILRTVEFFQFILNEVSFSDVV